LKAKDERLVVSSNNGVVSIELSHHRDRHG